MENEAEHHLSNRWMRIFVPVWIGQAFSLLGSGLVQFALVWWLTSTTGSTVVLATATLVALLPQVFLMPFAGALVDRWNRRRVMIIADSLVAFSTLCLAALFYFGKAEIWHVYVIMFVRSLGGAFHWPAMQASTSLMVPEKHLSRVAGANQALHGLINIGAPPLGAVLLSILPLQNVLAIDIITAVIAITPLLFIAIPQPKQSGTPAAVTPKTVWADVRSGFRYVASWPGLMIFILMATMINFLANPAFTFMPLLVTQHFKLGALELGWLESAFGAGVIGGGLLLTIWGGFRRKAATSLFGLIGMGVGITAVGLAPSWGYLIALGGMLLTGIMNPLCNGPFFALMQSKVEPEKQGRVFTLVGSLTSAMSPLSMVIAAPVAELLGLQVWYVAGGIFCIAMGIAGYFIPALITLDDQVPGQIQPTAPQPVPLVSD